MKPNKAKPQTGKAERLKPAARKSGKESRREREIRLARRSIFEILSRSYDPGEPGNILETHNDHCP